MRDFTIDHATGQAARTDESLRAHVENYVKDLGARIPTLHQTPLTKLLSLQEFGVFTYLGSPLVLRAHIRTALIHNLRGRIGGAFPTWRVIGVDALLNNIFMKDPEDAERINHDILFIMSPEAHTSEKIQDVLLRLITGRTVEGQTTVLCTHDTLKWFEGKAYSQAFQDLITYAKEGIVNKTTPGMVRSWNTRTPDDLR